MRRCLPRIFLALGLSLLLGAAQALQVCSDDIAATTPDSRFHSNDDGTVTDRSSGLIWKQCAEGLSGSGCNNGNAQALTWSQALQHAEAAVFAGSESWRLPNKNELASLVERRCYGPAINARFFPATPLSKSFWSSSPRASFHYDAWLVDFDDGAVYIGGRSGKGYVRLVRAGV